MLLEYILLLCLYNTKKTESIYSGNGSHMFLLSACKNVDRNARVELPFGKKESMYVYLLPQNHTFFLGS